MKKVALLLSIISVLALSCTKYSFMSYEEKVVGYWTFEKATVRNNWSMSNMDISNRYTNKVYIFESNKNFYAIDTFSNDTTTGYWSIEEETYYDENDNYETDYYLLIDMYDSTTSDYVYHNWLLSSVTAKKMRATMRDDNLNYNFILNRKN